MSATPKDVGTVLIKLLKDKIEDCFTEANRPKIFLNTMGNVAFSISDTSGAQEEFEAFKLEISKATNNQYELPEPVATRDLRKYYEIKPLTLSDNPFFKANVTASLTTSSATGAQVEQPKTPRSSDSEDDADSVLSANIAAQSGTGVAPTATSTAAPQDHYSQIPLKSRVNSAPPPGSTYGSMPPRLVSTNDKNVTNYQAATVSPADSKNNSTYDNTRQPSSKVEATSNAADNSTPPLQGGEQYSHIDIPPASTTDPKTAGYTAVSPANNLPRVPERPSAGSLPVNDSTGTPAAKLRARALSLSSALSVQSSALGSSPTSVTMVYTQAAHIGAATTLSASGSVTLTDTNANALSLTAIKQKLEQAVIAHNAAVEKNPSMQKVDWVISEDSANHLLSISNKGKDDLVCTVSQDENKAIQYSFPAGTLDINAADIISRASKGTELTLTSTSSQDILKIFEAAKQNGATIKLDETTKSYLEKFINPEEGSKPPNYDELKKILENDKPQKVVRPGLG